MKISCIILNYNDVETTIAQIRRVREFSCFEYIVIVDNCSTDDSVKQLQKYLSHKVILVLAEKNGGYGAGNNIGVRYSYRNLKMTHVVIANPDTIFTQACIKKMTYLFSRHPEVGAASATMQDSSNGSQASGWPLLPWFLDLMNTGPICRRLFKRVCQYPKSYFKTKNAVYVDAIHGSMLMLDAEKMLCFGGYDERVFLYNEESILARKMKNHGYRTVLMLSDTYFHQNSSTISKTYNSALKRQLLRHTSALFYYQNYLNINTAQLVVTKIFHRAILFEIWFCGCILKWHW